MACKSCRGHQHDFLIVFVSLRLFDAGAFFLGAELIRVEVKNTHA
jgi:hypothetical protein